MRVAQNDPALAHAIAKQMRNPAPRLNVFKKMSNGAGISYRHIIDAYGDDVFLQIVSKEYGARARWLVGVFDWSDGGVNAILVSKSNQQRVPLIQDLARFTPHAIARLLQRTLNSNDMDAVRGILRTACIKLTEQPVSDTLYLAEGCFLGDENRDNWRFHFNTWIDAQTASDPMIRQICNTVASD